MSWGGWGGGEISNGWQSGLNFKNNPLSTAKRDWQRNKLTMLGMAVGAGAGPALMGGPGMGAGAGMGVGSSGTAAAAISPTGGVMGAAYGGAQDAKRMAQQKLDEAQARQEAMINAGIKQRQKNVTSLNTAYGVGTSAEAQGNAVRLGSRINQQVGNAREQGMEDVTGAAGENMRQANIQMARNGTLGSSLGNHMAQTATAGYGQMRQQLASGLGNQREGAIAALGRERANMTNALAGGSALDPALNALQQGAALRSYSGAIPINTMLGMTNNVVGTGVMSAQAQARGYDTPDYLGLNKLTSGLGKMPGQTASAA